LPGRTGAGSRSRVTVERGIVLADVRERPSNGDEQRRHVLWLEVQEKEKSSQS
jgi:hypothetical protein